MTSQSLIGHALVQTDVDVLRMDERGDRMPQTLQGDDHGRWILLCLQCKRPIGIALQ